MSEIANYLRSITDSIEAGNAAKDKANVEIGEAVAALNEAFCTFFGGMNVTLDAFEAAGIGPAMIARKFADIAKARALPRLGDSGFDVECDRCEQDFDATSTSGRVYCCTRCRDDDAVTV